MVSSKSNLSSELEPMALANWLCLQFSVVDCRQSLGLYARDNAYTNDGYIIEPLFLFQNHDAPTTTACSLTPIAFSTFVAHPDRLLHFVLSAPVSRFDSPDVVAGSRPSGGQYFGALCDQGGDGYGGYPEAGI
jgi:hypothetical protein